MTMIFAIAFNYSKNNSGKIITSPETTMVTLSSYMPIMCVAIYLFISMVAMSTRMLLCAHMVGMR